MTHDVNPNNFIKQDNMEIIMEETTFPEIDAFYNQLPQDDIDNWFIRFTGTDRFGPNYNPAERDHNDPVGVYAYPLKWAYDQAFFKSYYGTEKPMANVFRVDLNNPKIFIANKLPQELINELKMRILNILEREEKNLYADMISDLSKHAAEEERHGWEGVEDEIYYYEVSAPTRAYENLHSWIVNIKERDWDQTNWFWRFTQVREYDQSKQFITAGTLTKILLQHDISAVYDIGYGIINRAEPWQILILDMRLCKDLHTFFVNKKTNQKRLDAAKVIDAALSGKVDLTKISGELWEKLMLKACYNPGVRDKLGALIVMCFKQHIDIPSQTLINKPSYTPQLVADIALAVVNAIIDNNIPENSLLKLDFLKTDPEELFNSIIRLWDKGKKIDILPLFSKMTPYSQSTFMGLLYEKLDNLITIAESHNYYIPETMYNLANYITWMLDKNGNINSGELNDWTNLGVRIKQHNENRFRQ